MMFKGDRSHDADLDAGLPRAQSGEDVPRWLVVLGAAAGLTLLVALLRYAVDLLGVVFVIILIGFAIRTVSDWLTEGEAVSGWTMSALSLSLIGTVLVGLWLFNSRETDAIEARLPGPVQRSVSWLERHGWGQRVLLPAGSLQSAGVGNGVLGEGAGRIPSAAAAEPAASAPEVRMAPSLPAAPSRPPGRARPRAERRPDVSAAEAAPAPAPGGPGRTEPGAAPPVAPAATSLGLRVTPARAVVGTSVRLTATVAVEGSEAAPRGTVVFSNGSLLLGRVPVHRIEGAYQAVLVTLDLPIGEHDLHAAYEGDARHAPSRSAVVRQSVVRK